jgi:hypothetical protein
MSDAKTVMKEANAIDPEIQFTEEACEPLVRIPSMFRGMALSQMVKQAKEKGVKTIDRAFVDEARKSSGF